MNEQPNIGPEQLPTEDEPQFYRTSTQTTSAPQSSSYAGYELSQEMPAPPPQPNADDAAMVKWEASEYVHHTKGALWLFGYIGVMLVFAIIAFITQAWTFLILVIVMGVALGIIAFRPPNTLHYSLTSQGLQIDSKFYGFDSFRSFGIIGEGALYSIMLIPTKRFLPAVSIYFEERDGEKIVDILASQLPMEHIELDAFDKLMRYLRF